LLRRDDDTTRTKAMAERRKRKRRNPDAIERPVADQKKPDEQDAPAGAADVPGQPEPSAEAEGEYEPELNEAEVRPLTR
jgi:hypothetical protein